MIEGRVRRENVVDVVQGLIVFLAVHPGSVVKQRSNGWLDDGCSLETLFEVVDMGILHADAHAGACGERIQKGVVAFGISSQAFVGSRWHDFDVLRSADRLMAGGQKGHAAAAQFFKEAFDEAQVRLVHVLHFHEWAVGPFHLAAKAQGDALFCLEVSHANQHAVFFDAFPASTIHIFQKIRDALFVAVVHSSEILGVQKHMVKGYIELESIVIGFKRFHKINQLIF